MAIPSFVQFLLLKRLSLLFRSGGLSPHFADTAATDAALEAAMEKPASYFSLFPSIFREICRRTAAQTSADKASHSTNRSLMTFFLSIDGLLPAKKRWRDCGFFTCRSTAAAAQRKPCRVWPRRGPFRGRCHGWHPGSRPWHAWPDLSYLPWRRSQPRPASADSFW